MATKVKKQTSTTKEIVSSPSNKNEASTSSATQKAGAKLQSDTGEIKKKGRGPMKNSVKSITAVKKTVQLKAKNPRKDLKINPKTIARVLMENGKDLEGKKILLKNGAKEGVKRGRRPRVPKIKVEPGEDPPPVLEPIFPQDDNTDVKKTPKKRGRKPYKLPQLIDIKSEPLDETVSTSEISGDPAALLEVTAPKIKKPRQRKPKVEPATLEEVMTDLTFLIDTAQIKTEAPHSALEAGKISTPKVKRMTKKQRLDAMKDDFTKKENIEKTVRKLNPAEAKLIDRLDLNVTKYKTDFPKVKRRHSIEKFPLSSVDSCVDGLMIPQLSVFSQMPRSISPRTSRKVFKMGLKRPSPYSTRSDAPTRLLRNGKHRQLKNFTLLEGLENPTRRKRLQSDFSGCETPSKMSGYESDSSYSDLASLHGSEKDTDVSKLANKDVDGLLTEESSHLDFKPVAADLIKNTGSTELDRPLFDTNSNVCDTVNDSIEIGEQAKLEYIDSNTPLEDRSSSKVPDKGILLDIMKQTFNDMDLDMDPAKSEVSKFYSGAGTSMQNVEMKVSSISPNDVSDAAASTGDLSQSTISEEISEEEELIRLLSQTAPVPNDERIKEDNRGSKTSNDESFEDILKDCIANDSSGLLNYPKHSTPSMILPEQAPMLLEEITVQDPEKEDVIPVIDNMAVAVLEPQQNQENLEPPLLESSVLLPEPTIVKSSSKIESKTPVIDDKKIGIAVTEKDNVVLFSIEHLTDDSGDLEVSNEDLSQTVEENKSQSSEVAEEASNHVNEYFVPDANVESAQSESKIEESKSDQNPVIVDTVESVSVANESKELSETSEATEQVNTIVAVDVVDVPVNEEREEALEIEQSEMSVETDVHRTDKECDKTSETIIVKSDTVDDNKVTENGGQESPEELAKKTSILNALGLQSLHAVKEAGPSKKKGKASSSKSDGYTGTLKTVIKINKKKGKNSFKMTLQKNKNKVDAVPVDGEDAYKILKEAGSSSSSKYNKDSSDTAGAHRKSHYSNRSNMDGSSEHTSDSEQASTSHDKSQPEKSLIVPEKASSFSIHPERLCKDECSYCFGKFGLFDTPCHIAQMKSVERQNKILATETHLTWESCLCDACYRHIDRKSNSPSYMNKSLKRNSLVAPGPRQNHCYVLGCNNVSTNILRRKWIIKMRKSICQVINIDLDNPGLHSIPICDEHFTALEHLMICAMCKRRLARNHIHYLGPEVKELNEALQDEDIPIALPDKPVVCKLCKCFASIILKDPEERMENSISFFKDYKRRLLHFNNILPMDSAVALEPIMIPSKSEKNTDKKKPDSAKKRKRIRNSSNDTNSQKDSQDEKDDHEDELEVGTKKRVPSTDTNNSRSANQSRAQSPEDGDEYGGVDYNTLIPAIAMDCPSDSESKKDGFNNKSDGLDPMMPKLESMSNSIEISAYKSSEDASRSNDLAAQKLVQNPSISLKPNYTSISNELWRDGPSSKLISNPALSVRQLFPGEEELGLVGDIDFQNVSARTPEGWEKSVATIQYDEDTKVLWQELQKPYGSISSFLRHLTLLEKYFRNGDLVLSPSASHHAVNYRESVHNRLRAYDNIPSNTSLSQPSNILQFNKMTMKTSGGGITNQSDINGLPPVTISQIGRSNEKIPSRTPITLQQLNQPPLYPTNAVLQNLAASKSRPPGLISINQRALAPTTVKAPIPSQKIKFPITKNWRPNLIPISSSKKAEKKSGLIQVVSGGKPYHITIEDYKKMCAIKRSFEAKQKKLQDAQQFTKQISQKQQAVFINHHSVLKTLAPKKGLLVSKTSGGSVSETKPISLIPISSAPATVTSGGDSSETILEKLDKQVERLSQDFDPAKISGIVFEKNPAIQIIPKIPKSLTVIPQTVSKASPSRAVLHVIKSSSTGSSNGEDSNSQP